MSGGSSRGGVEWAEGSGYSGSGVAKGPLLIVALNVNFQFQLGTAKTTQFTLPAQESHSICVLAVVVVGLQLHNSSYNQRGKQQLLFYVAAAAGQCAVGTGRGRGSYSSCATITWCRCLDLNPNLKLYTDARYCRRATCSCWRGSYAHPQRVL